MSTGMVQVDRTTYRIVRAGRGLYHAVRILDDRLVGTFATEPKLEVVRSEIGLALMTEVATTALRAGRVQWSRRMTSNADF